MGPRKSWIHWVVTGEAKWLLLILVAIVALGWITPLVYQGIPRNTPDSAAGGLVRVTASLLETASLQGRE